MFGKIDCQSKIGLFYRANQAVDFMIGVELLKHLRFSWGEGGRGSVPRRTRKGIVCLELRQIS